VNLPFNWFDILLLAVLGVGLVQGRKRGMSGEWVGVVKWLIILFGCALISQPLGGLIAAPGVFGPTVSCVVAYLSAMLLVFLVFARFQRRLHAKPVDTDFFGRGEYYLGMACGGVRLNCMLLVVLALLHARSFSPSEIKAIDDYQASEYGSHVFPTFPAVQAAVFDKSLTGPWIKQYLWFLLINTAENPPKQTR
jgi:hypothetical protein